MNFEALLYRIVEMMVVMIVLSHRLCMFGTHWNVTKHSGAKIRRNKEERMAEKKEIIRQCECCGNIFTAQKTTTRFCSHKCNSKSYKLRKKEEANATPSTGKSFKMVGISYSTMQEIERLSDAYEKIKDKEFLSVQETAFLLSIGRTTAYRYLQEGMLKAIQIKGKTFIRRSDIDLLFDNAGEYQSKAKSIVEPKPLIDFYTVAEIKERFNVKESWLYKIIRENEIPKTLIRGRSYISKSHIDKYFKKKGFNDNEDIEQWYSVNDIVTKYGLSTNAIYSFVAENQIRKKKDGRSVLYSQVDFDVAKGYIEPTVPQYISVPEAMELYNITRDALYHYIKYHTIPKIKEGRNIKIAKTDLDKLFNPLINQ